MKSRLLISAIMAAAASSGMLAMAMDPVRDVKPRRSARPLQQYKGLTDEQRKHNENIDVIKRAKKLAKQMRGV